MSTRQSHHLRALHIETLKLQQEHLFVLRDRYRIWITESDDIESNHIRRDIIDLIEKVVDQHNHLLEAGQRQGDGELEEYRT